jgi:hypothetical protein
LKITGGHLETDFSQDSSHVSGCEAVSSSNLDTRVFRSKDYCSMKRIIGFLLPRILCLAMLLLWSVALHAGVPDSYHITPDKTTMLIGDMRPFRMVDQNGRLQHKVIWTLSDADAFEVFDGDQIQLISKRAGEFRLMARTDFATAEATVKVIDGPSLPAGTVKWTSGKMSGCKTVKILPAAPRPNGPDIYEQSVCEDGEYLAAYTLGGVQLWRRKIGDHGAVAGPGGPGGNQYEIVGNRLEPNSTSACELVSEGMDQQKIRDLLAQHHLSFREETTGGRVWLVAEPSTQCRMWFDEKSVLVKKRKVFVAD